MWSLASPEVSKAVTECTVPYYGLQCAVIGRVSMVGLGVIITMTRNQNNYPGIY